MESNIKLCTDLKQSKKLKKILPLETADMHYSTWTILDDGEFILSPNQGSTIEELQKDYGNQIIPCWSLAALLERVLPNKIVVDNIGYEKSCKFSFGDNSWYLSYNDYDDVAFCTTTVEESLLDACYEMILELHKMNLL